MRRTISVDLNARRMRRKTSRTSLVIAVTAFAVVSALAMLVVNMYSSASGSGRVVRGKDRLKDDASERGLQMMGSALFTREDTSAAPYREAGADDDEEGDMNGRLRKNALLETPAPLQPCEYGGVAIYASSSASAEDDGNSRKCSLGEKYGGEAVVETTNLVSASLVNLSRRRIIDDWRRAAEILDIERHAKALPSISMDLLGIDGYSTLHRENHVVVRPPNACPLFTERRQQMLMTTHVLLIPRNSNQCVCAFVYTPFPTCAIQAQVSSRAGCSPGMVQRT